MPYALGNPYTYILGVGTSSKQLPAVPVADRVVNLQAILLAFIARFKLPLSLASELVKLMKLGFSDDRATDMLKLDRTTASYKLVYGLAKTFKEDINGVLQHSFFSLNIDESTSENRKRILALLISFYDEKAQQVQMRFFDSISLVRATANNVYDVVVKLFRDRNIPLTNLMSILMDSCGVMRGSCNGFEKQMRSGPVPHLLDIDSDSCHHAHNAAKDFSKPLDRWTEALFGDIYTDFNFSADLLKFLDEICLLVNIKFANPPRFVSHRWLRAYTCSVETLRMWDVYVLFYYGFLSSEDRALYRHVLKDVYKRRNVSDLSVAAVERIQGSLRVKCMAQDGKERKLMVRVTDLVSYYPFIHF